MKKCKTCGAYANLEEVPFGGLCKQKDCRRNEDDDPCVVYDGEIVDDLEEPISLIRKHYVDDETNQNDRRKD